MRISSDSEKPVRRASRRLVDWLKPSHGTKVHSLVDKIYHPENLHVAWKKVKANRGSGGIDGESLEDFEEGLEGNLRRLHEELRDKTYRPAPVREHLIPKAGKPGKYRKLGIPTVYDRVCQQAMKNRLEPIFEEAFDAASFGYRPKRSAWDAVDKVTGEIGEGREWIVDADLKDFFTTVDHDKLMELLNQRVSDGRVLGLVEDILKAGVQGKGGLRPTEQGTPQGGVISPLLSNVLLTPFDREMRKRGYRLTRYADDWCITCDTRDEAARALLVAGQVLSRLGVTLNRDKTRIVHISQGLEFLGLKIKRGVCRLELGEQRIKSGARRGAVYRYPTQQSLDSFKEKIRRMTRRNNGLSTRQLIDRINPVLRGWGNYYRKANVRKLFNRLGRWIVRRIWSHRRKRWRNCGWRELPETRLYGELDLVNLVGLIGGIRERGQAPKLL